MIVVVSSWTILGTTRPSPTQGVGNLLTPRRNKRKIMLFRDFDRRVTEQDRNLIDRDASQKQVNGECVSESVRMPANDSGGLEYRAKALPPIIRSGHNSALSAPEVVASRVRLDSIEGGVQFRMHRHRHRLTCLAHAKEDRVIRHDAVLVERCGIGDSQSSSAHQQRQRKEFGMIFNLLHNSFPFRTFLWKVLLIEGRLRSRGAGLAPGMLKFQCWIVIAPFACHAQAEESPQQLNALGTMSGAASPGGGELGQRRHAQLIECREAFVTTEFEKASRDLASGSLCPFRIGAEECRTNLPGRAFGPAIGVSCRRLHECVDRVHDRNLLFVMGIIPATAGFLFPYQLLSSSPGSRVETLAVHHAAQMTFRVNRAFAASEATARIFSAVLFDALPSVPPEDRKHRSILKPGYHNEAHCAHTDSELSF